MEHFDRVIERSRLKEFVANLGRGRSIARPQQKIKDLPPLFWVAFGNKNFHLASDHVPCLVEGFFKKLFTPTSP
jgi:hypothetical protein